MTFPFNNRPVFFVDAMLGNIAKKLRLFGFDTKYESNISDELLIKEVFHQKRILITKDRKLYHKLRNSGILVILPSRLDETLRYIDCLRELVEAGKVSDVPQPIPISEILKRSDQ